MKMKYFFKTFIIVILLCGFSLKGYCLSLSDAQQDYLYGNYEEAIQKAQSLRQDDEALYFLGLVYIKIADYPQAQDYLNKLIKRCPSSRLHGPAMVKLADTYFLQADYPPAKELYLETIKRYPDLDNVPTVYLRLAQIASRQGDWDKKDEYLKVLKTKHPQSAEMQFVSVLEGYGDFFTIQVGAFSEKKNALVLKDELDKDFSAYMVEETNGNYTIYKVRVGKFKDRYDVEKIAKQLLDKGYPARIYP